MEARNTNFVFKQNRKDNWNEILTMGNNRKETVNCNNFMFKCEYRCFCGKCLNQLVHIVLIITCEFLFLHNHHLWDSSDLISDSMMEYYLLWTESKYPQFQFSRYKEEYRHDMWSSGNTNEWNGDKSETVHLPKNNTNPQFPIYFVQRAIFVEVIRRGSTSLEHQASQYWCIALRPKAPIHRCLKR